MTAVEFGRVPRGGQAQHARGWAISVVCHLVGIGGALFAMAEAGKPVLSNTFQWDIAMVEAPPVAEPPPAPPMPVVPKPAPVPPRPVERTMETRSAAQAVAQVTREVASPVDQSVAVSADAIMARSIVERSESPAAVAQGPVEVAAPIVSSDAVVAVAHAVTERAGSVTEQAAVVQQPAVMERPSGSPGPDLPAVSHRSVQHRLVAHRQILADYGWLRDALWERIEELKRYPPMARANHWEGRVVVEAVIRADGTVAQLHVAESSGHALLDQDALVVMKKASPLALRHPLDQPHIVIQVPIQYRLDG